jgi:hypothetical protein
VYLDLSTWGWIHLVLGVVVVICGFGVFTGNVLARAVAVILAGLSMLANFLFIPSTRSGPSPSSPSTFS